MKNSFLIILALLSVTCACRISTAAPAEEMVRPAVPIHRYALLVGISQYPDYPSLPGVKRDIRRMHYLFEKRFGFNQVQVLTEQDATQEHILQAFKLYQQRLQPRDLFCFYFSGYGSYVPDDNGDEADGLDEILCPYDLDRHWQNSLSDDLLHDLIAGFKPKVRIIVMLDCGHSDPAAAVPHTRYKVRSKTILPHPNNLLYQEVQKRLVQEQKARTEMRSIRMLDHQLPMWHIYIGAARGHAGAYDVKFRQGYHGLLTCCLSANAQPNLNYQQLMVRTLIACRTAGGVPQAAPYLSCAPVILKMPIFK